MIYNATILGRIPSKKNSKIMVCRGRTPILLPSSAYTAWHKEVSLQLKKIDKVIESCEVILTIYAPDKRGSDLTNKAESIMDLLVDNHIIKDDNWFVVNTVTLKLGGVDKDNPRVDIEIHYANN